METCGLWTATESASPCHGTDGCAMTTCMSGKSAATSSRWIGLEYFMRIPPPPRWPDPTAVWPVWKTAGSSCSAITSYSGYAIRSSGKKCCRLGWNLNPRTSWSAISRFAHSTPSAPRCGSIETNGISASPSSAASSRISSFVTGPPQRTLSTMKQTASISRSREKGASSGTVSSASEPKTWATAFSGESSGKPPPRIDAWTCVCTSIALSFPTSTVALIARGNLVVEEIDRRADDRVRVDPDVAVEVLDVARLAEVADAERRDRHPADRRQKAQRVRVAVEDGDDRRGAGGREELVEDCGLALEQPLAGLQRAEDEIGRREADDVGRDAGGR